MTTGRRRSAGASREAKRLAAVLLDVLAGARTPPQAAEVLGVSLPRYYQLEDRGLAGLVAACEARPRGRQANASNGVACVDEGERAAEEGAGPVPGAGAADAADGRRAAAGPGEGGGPEAEAEAGGPGDAAGRAAAGGSGRRPAGADDAGPPRARSEDRGRAGGGRSRPARPGPNPEGVGHAGTTCGRGRNTRSGSTGRTVACRRMRVVLETIAGTKRVPRRVRELGICQQRFEAIRQDAIQAGVAGPGAAAGRPAAHGRRRRPTPRWRELRNAGGRTGSRRCKRAPGPGGAGDRPAPAGRRAKKTVTPTATGRRPPRPSRPRSGDLIERPAARSRATDRRRRADPRPTADARSGRPAAAGRGSSSAPQRDTRTLVRRRAAAVGRRLFGLGWAWARIADLFHVAGRTLRHWCHDLLDRLRPGVPARPAAWSGRRERLATRSSTVLDEFGPQVGVPTLRESLPGHEPGRTGRPVDPRYRRVWRERNREPLRVLTLAGAGPGVGNRLRRAARTDRRSRRLPVGRPRPGQRACRLLWRPVVAATAAEAAAGLAGLFAEHGPPLVLKSDNGSHFTGGGGPGPACGTPGRAPALAAALAAVQRSRSRRASAR